ncbi:hypothetical protein Hanom_Chr05g00457651 [Helianthus anomalus]
MQNFNCRFYKLLFQLQNFIISLHFTTFDISYYRIKLSMFMFIFSLVLLPKLINGLSRQVFKILDIIIKPHFLVKLCHKPGDDPVTVFKKTSGEIIPLIPTLPLSWFCEPFWCVSCF